ncbi:uncharacterized protein [Euphorbia lathyris]|uniref:uncharacterized protein n=1 Tax=Euphorbia lathyris TaxID=212925 RepID=UPI00331448B9
MEIVKMLSAGSRPSKTSPTSTGKMAYNSSIKRSSTPQKNSKIVKDTVLQTQAIERSARQEMLTAKRHISKTYADLPHEPRQRENDGNLIQQKISKNCPGMAVMVKSTKDDELVRYMSNVPGYLQRVEKKEDMQGKALNVGVLDWGRLENYKCSQKDIPVGMGNNATLASSNLSTKITKRSSAFLSPTGIDAPAYGNKQYLSSSSRNNSYHNGDIFQNAEPSSQDAVPSRDVENASNCMFDEQKRAARNCRSSVTNSSETTLAKAKRRESDHKITSKVEHQPSKTKYKRVPTRFKESVSSYDREDKQTVDELQRLDIDRKEPKQIFTSSMGTSASEPRKNRSGSVKEKQNVDNSRTNNQIESQETTIDHPLQHHADKNRNIVLLVPRSHNSLPKQPIMSLDEKVKDAKPNFLSDACSDKEGFSSELHYEIPHSCPLPSRADTGTGQHMAPDVMNTLDDEASSDLINNAASESLDETLKTLNQETADLATIKARHPSPNRRFSFSLSRMTRSFSFKESSGVPQLSSTYNSVKSGPVTSTSSAGTDNPNREKESVHIRARSSPLRRILDPLLPKFKGKTSSFTDERILDPLLPKFKGKTSSFTDETDQLLRSIDSSSFKPIKAVESLENEKHEASSIQAQLVFTTSNGLPLFRFVTNSSIIIAAPLKNVIAPGKNDPGCNYVLYAIDEVKKKNGSWINQASKEKTCFVYNVVGQMKLNSSSSLDFSVENLNNQHVVTESVLSGTEPRQAGQGLPKAVPNTELAAVIMKKPNAILGFEIQQSDKEENVKDKDFSWCLPENVQTSCTVILPGGVHSLPKTGVPSSLIRRWKSGGLCDCGGWDIGCRLRVLSNENQQQKLTRTFSSFLKSDCLELFIQGERETQQHKPIFSMEPFEKGKYSVEFSSSISLLQAFFIGVSVISCQRSSDLAEDSNSSEEKAFRGSSNGINGLKTVRTSLGKEVPMKYTPTPPLSPVGRV